MTSRRIADGPAVLVIEDDRRSADLLRSTSRRGYAVTVAADGEEGLLARAAAPAVVLLDIGSRDGRLGRPGALKATRDCRARSSSSRCSTSAARVRARRRGLPRQAGEPGRARARCCAGRPSIARTVVVIDDDEPPRARRGRARPGRLRATRTEGLELCAVAPRRRAARPADARLDGFAVVERCAPTRLAEIPIVVLTAKDLTPADRDGCAAASSTSPRRASLGRTPSSSRSVDRLSRDTDVRRQETP